MSNLINAKLEGFEETMRAFKDLEDGAMKVRLVRRAERKAMIPYLRAVQRGAVYALNDGGELSASFGDKTTAKMKRKQGWIDSRSGARNRGKLKGKRMTYAGLAAVFNSGTKERRTRSGRKTGRIRAKRFIDHAFLKTHNRMEATLKHELFKMIKRRVRKEFNSRVQLR